MKTKLSFGSVIVWCDGKVMAASSAESGGCLQLEYFTPCSIDGSLRASVASPLSEHMCYNMNDRHTPPDHTGDEDCDTEL